MRSRRWQWRLVNFLASLLLLGVLFSLGQWGFGSIPPLGKVLNPGTGIWTMATDAKTPQNQTLQIQGLQQPVTVTFESNGTPHIQAATDHDLFMTLGYLHAKDRLFQMDLLRRQGEGLLSAVNGRNTLSSDIFELQLGLLRSAQAEWNQTRVNDTGKQVILAYTQGINARINEDEREHNLPMMFKLLNYQPDAWSPVDTLVIQRVMTQTLNFSTGPLEYSLLVQSLGYQRTMQWFPIVPVNEQHPYDPGPYSFQGVTPLSSALTPTATNDATNSAALDLINRIASLPTNAVHHGSNSNSWVVDGTKTASGKPLMAGDPHLDQTLPSIWYQIDCHSPGYTFSGVSIPGLPVILIGKNQHISWSITNTQNQSTLYYKETMDAQHPHQYYWKGNWHPTTQLHETIPVKHAAPITLTVELTIHGPIMTQTGQTLSVWWTGSLRSPDLDAMLSILQAHDFQQFRSSLRSWLAPTQNFSYADDQGNIGLISAGYYPQVKAGQPWLPLSGTGESDVSGTIPFDAIPQAYNPPNHILFSANQRVVGPDYPYYIGTSLDDFDPGYRANTIYHTLSQGKQLTVADMQNMQNDTHDSLAQKIVPSLLAALAQSPLHSTLQQQATILLSAWDGNMTTSSTAATIWTWFWNQYLFDTFHPWWQAFHVPEKSDSKLLITPESGGGVSDILGESLEVWTLHDQTNPVFSPPNGTSHTTSSAMLQAFTETINALSQTFGNNFQNWSWGKVHMQVFPSLTQIRFLGDPPRPRPGNARSLNAADGGAVVYAGPSWRFIMDWNTRQGIGVYPGGQSENPLSPWYDNQIAAWENGRYYPLYTVAQSRSISTIHTWILQPER